MHRGPEMRAVLGFLIAVLIFVGLPTLAFLTLFNRGVADIDFMADLAGLPPSAFVRLLAKAIYALAFWILSWGLSGLCAKRFLEIQGRRKIQN